MILSVFVALLVLLILWVVKRIMLICRLPPGPWGLPLLGSGIAVDLGNLPNLLTRWHKRYGDIFSISLPVHQDVIVVSSYELIHEVLVKRSSDFSDRPPCIRAFGFLDFNTEIVFTNDTPQRRVLKKALAVSLKMYGERLIVLEEIAIFAVQELIEKWRKQSGSVINPAKNLSDFVCKTLSSLVFHKAFTQEEAKSWAEIDYKGFLSLTDKAQYLEIFPWLRYLPNVDWTFFQDTNKEMMSFIYKKIEHRMNDFDGINPECTLDALKLYQAKYNKENKENIISDTNIAYLLVDIMIPGLTTTLRTAYALLAILADPDHSHVVRKMQDEIDRNIGKDPPRIADKQRHKLPYIEAVIMESIRYWTMPPILLPHAATIDTPLAGYTVPKGTWIWCNMFNLSHDSRYWDEPFKFNPQRFLDENGDLVPADHMNRKRSLQFGADRRVCSGDVFAKNRLFLIITSIIQNFDLSLAPGKNKPNHDCRRNFVGGLFSMPEEYEILIHSRSGKKN